MNLGRSGVESLSQEIIEVMQRYKEKSMEYWLSTLFSFNWWILLVVTLSVLTIWFVILDKRRILEIATYGLMVATVGFLGDSIGLYLVLWQYKASLTPIPQIVEIHLILMPVFYMVIYQYFNTWKAFLIASVTLAFLFALVLEPLLVWLNIYELYSWKHFYSLIPYFLIAVGLRWIMIKLKKLDHHYK